MTLGERIAGLRKQKKMSQEELAAAMDVSRQAVSKWENSLCNPDTENLIRLADILDVDISALIGDDPPPEPLVCEAGNTNKHRSLIWVMSILLFLAVSAAVMFALLWRQALRLQSVENPSTSATILDTRWESVRMFTNSGTLRQEISLTPQEQHELAERIWNCAYADQSPSSDQEIVYGGLVVEVEFVRNQITYTWSFTTSHTIYRTCLEDGTTESYRYEPDRNMLNWLETFL